MPYQVFLKLTPFLHQTARRWGISNHCVRAQYLFDKQFSTPLQKAEITELQYWDSHYQDSRRQKAEMRKQIEEMDSKTVNIEMDWKSKVHLPLSRMRTTSDSSVTANLTRMGVLVRWLNEGKRCEHIFYFPQKVTQATATTALTILFSVIQQKEIEMKKSVNIWTDSGLQFVSNSFVATSILNIADKLDKTIAVHFYIEGHGESDLDRDFGVLQRQINAIHFPILNYEQYRTVLQNFCLQTPNHSVESFRVHSELSISSISTLQVSVFCSFTALRYLKGFSSIVRAVTSDELRSSSNIIDTPLITDLPKEIYEDRPSNPKSTRNHPPKATKSRFSSQQYQHLEFHKIHVELEERAKIQLECSQPPKIPILKQPGLNLSPESQKRLLEYHLPTDFSKQQVFITPKQKKTKQEITGTENPATTSDSLAEPPIQVAAVENSDKLVIDGTESNISTDEWSFPFSEDSLGSNIDGSSSSIDSDRAPHILLAIGWTPSNLEC
ncbi:hypothetical protein BLNAU_3660 [Blattamonas nauphoetae]|uniref:Integrase catalytic domain-containing protein n=1 Tax=Blattamonas nauphoetae TaxID=2049346 RepID=A0ABQ9YBV2_9EUKA|nr:hypothetical protein BLNAU_3660 [Blattamonas nauphoetae]